MTRNWIAVALLSVSWMWGLEYYTSSNGWLWAIAVLAAIPLLAESPRRLPRCVNAAIAALLALPTLWLLPRPYGAISLCLASGLLPLAFSNPPERLRSLGWGGVRTAMILAGQGVVLRAYALWTARSHDLPQPGPALVAGLARLLGADASADGSHVTIFSTSGPQRLGATWELVFDPVSVGVLAGAIVLVAVWAWEDRISQSERRHWSQPWLANIGRVVLAIGLWMPIRLAVLLGLFLHREMRAPEELKLTVMNQFFSPWVLAIASIGAVACLAYWMRRQPPDLAHGEAELPLTASDLRNVVLTPVVVLALIGVGTALLLIDPIGSPKAGRVVFVERHSEWEPTDRAYDTESFGHDPSYSYTCIYDYCGQFFDVSRILEEEKIDTARLSECDVLVIKTPTAPYSSDEIRAIHRFVEGGGGLLLIGEHTDFMRIGLCLNHICSPLGFKFRPDNLFAVHDPYVQHVAPRRFPHPAVRNVPFIRYAGSCSIDPGWSWGRAAVWNTGLWGLGADYNMENFFRKPIITQKCVMERISSSGRHASERGVCWPLPTRPSSRISVPMSRARPSSCSTWSHG